MSRILTILNQIESCLEEKERSKYLTPKLFPTLESFFFDN